MKQVIENRTPLQRLLWLGGMAKAAGGKGVEETASGNPVVFTTDLARPLSRLALSLLPRQSGTGDPSPENIRPLLPWGEVGTWTGGKNLFNKETVVPGVWWKGNILHSGSYDDDYRASEKIPVLAGQRYTLTRQSPQQAAVCYFGKDKSYIDQQTWDKYNPSRIIPDGVCYVAFTVEAESVDSAMFEFGNVVSAFTPYTPITPHPVDLTGITPPVYGCSVDLTTGEVWGTWALFTAKWKDGEYPEVFNSVTRKRFALSQVLVPAGSTQTAFCDIAKWYWHFEADEVHFYADQGRAFVFLPNDTDGETDIHIVGKLATPVLLATLTPQQISAIVGVNTVWSDADNVDVTYLKKG